MRGIAVILIFLFLISPVAAFDNGDGTGQFTITSTVVADYDAPESATYTVNSCPVTRIFFNDVGATAYVSNVICTIPLSQWQGGSDNSDWGAVSFKIGGVEVATGTFGYMKGTSYVYAGAFFEEDTDITNGGTFSGQQVVTITGDVPNVRTHAGGHAYATGFKRYVDVDQATDTLAYMGFYETENRVVATYTGGGDVKHETKSIYSFENPYTYSQTYNSLDFTLDKSSSHQSQVIITNNGGKSILNETSINAIDIDIHEFDLTNTTWTVGLTNVFGDHFSDTIYYEGEASAGQISLNQSLYVEPELIQIDAELTTYDFDNHIYRILMEYSTDAGANWERLSVVFNSTSTMSNTTECRTATIDSGYYTLPIKIRAVIDDYNKVTSSSSTIATSSEVYYNPPSAYDYIVSGTVFDADNGAVIEGAVVSASGVTTTSSTSTVTGKFQLYLSEGYYTITTSKSGYQDNVQTDLLIDHDVDWAQIHLTPIGYGNNTLYGNVNDVDTGNAIQDVHVIITNATDQIDAYTSSGGYYEATGLAQSSTYAIRALKTGYHPYNGTVTTEASGASHKSFEMAQVNYSVTPTPTEISTYPGGEGHEWSNEEIVTMLRVLVPGFFMMMLIFLFIAVILGVTGGGGANGGQRGLGLDEIWKR